MYRYIRYIVLILTITLCGIECSYAQNVSVQAPSKVPAGDNFRLSYTVNAQDVDDFRAGNIPSGIEVQLSNGKWTY